MKKTNQANIGSVYARKIPAVDMANESVPRPSTAYENAYGHLQESINLLRNAVAAIEERLQPILTPLDADDGSDGCCPPDSAYSPVVGSIHNRADEIAQLGVRVQAIVSRLEV